MQLLTCVGALADHVEVDGASCENGLLQIDLVRRLPETMKPRLSSGSRRSVSRRASRILIIVHRSVPSALGGRAVEVTPANHFAMGGVVSAQCVPRSA